MPLVALSLAPLGCKSIELRLSIKLGLARLILVKRHVAEKGVQCLVGLHMQKIALVLLLLLLLLLSFR